LFDTLKEEEDGLKALEELGLKALYADTQGT
jgi:hypothetical protein